MQVIKKASKGEPIITAIKSEESFNFDRRNKNISVDLYQSEILNFDAIDYNQTKEQNIQSLAVTHLPNILAQQPVNNRWQTGMLPGSGGMHMLANSMVSGS